MVRAAWLAATCCTRYHRLLKLSLEPKQERVNWDRERVLHLPVPQASVACAYWESSSSREKVARPHKCEAFSAGGCGNLHARSGKPPVLAPWRTPLLREVHAMQRVSHMPSATLKGTL